MNILNVVDNITHLMRKFKLLIILINHISFSFQNFDNVIQVLHKGSDSLRIQNIYFLTENLVILKGLLLFSLQVLKPH